MIKLVLLRHGESIWNKENLFTGWTDVDLSDQGTQSSILFAGQVRYFLPPTSSNVEPLESKSSTQRSE